MLKFRLIQIKNQRNTFKKKKKKKYIYIYQDWVLLLNTTNRAELFHFCISWRPCGSPQLCRHWLNAITQKKCSLHGSTSPRLMEHFSSHGHTETRQAHVSTVSTLDRLEKPQRRRMSPGTGAEGYYDHVAILHFVVWRRCAWTGWITQTHLPLKKKKKKGQRRTNCGGESPESTLRFTVREQKCICCRRWWYLWQSFLCGGSSYVVLMNASP